MLKKLLAVTIICLLIGLGIASSAVDTVEDAYDFDVKEITTPSKCNKKFYAVDCGSNYLVWFDPCTPGIFNNIAQFPSTLFPTGGAFTGDDWWVCDITGNLWIIDPISGASTSVGNSGTGELIDIEYDPNANTMWGISISNFYIIDMNTGAATYAGGPSVNISDIATDKYGNMWGIGGDFQSYYLYSINTSTWNVTIIGEAGMPGYYDLSYEKDEEIMWLCAFNYNTFMCELWTIDPATAAMTFIGTLQGGAQTTCLAIPYDWGNQRPTAPYVTGPKNGKVGVEYNWTFISTDPEEDNITYYIDWADECGGAEWYGPYPSGEEVTIAHTYTYENTFTINTLAVDENGAESNWTYFEVTMPKNKQVSNMWFLQWLERFPLLNQIANLLMEKWI